MSRTRPRPSDLAALGFWLTAGALLVVGAVVGPEGQCDYANHDAYVASSNRAAVWLFASALTIAAAAVFLAAGTRGRGRRQPRILRGLAAICSLAASCLVGFFALLAFVGFGCLE
jgi:hypothetical protein